MVTTCAILHGDRTRYLRFDVAEHPVALQLGGSDADALAQCAAIGESFGYDEINLNCGCPSDRVQGGGFGACLMSEPEQVAAAVRAMRGATSLPVTVKHRIGVDDSDEYEFMRSEEHTSELQSLMRISYAVFCLKKTKKTHTNQEMHLQ